MQWVWIGIGGALGSLLRFLLQGRAQTAYGGLFPLGTLGVNLIGSAAIGFLGGWFISAPVPTNLRLFLMVGILGGFTTFSSFSLDALTLIRSGHARMALSYMLASNVLGVALAFGGFLCAQALARALAIGNQAG